MTDTELESTLAQIRRAGAETEKLIDEARKLRAEEAKFRAETEKSFDEARRLRAEAGTFEHERTTLAMTAGAAILGTGAVLGGLLLRLLTGH